MTIHTDTLIRQGRSYWWNSFVSMLRFDLASLRESLVTVALLQLLMGAGMAIIYGFYFDEIPQVAATFIVTGTPTLAIVPVGMALVPGVVMQHRLDETYDFLWSLPVPRLTIAASNFVLFTGLAMPGVALSLVVAAWRYNIDLTVSWSVIPAVLLAALMANSVGFGFAHAIAEPRITNLIVNMIIFLVLLFSPVAFPISNFPDWFASVHRVLPFFHMANIIRGGLTEGLVTGLPVSYLVVGLWMLGSWALVAWVVGRRR
ncbi:MAG: ABC transporter permease [Acidimicrobiia bacterium]|nr:ABC transporter permease [Acidimicrobiia bacterium]